MNIRIATEEERPALYAIRTEVFVNEQKVPPELELDAEDAHAIHILAEEGGVAVGCARLLLREGEAHIGRLAVKKDCRGRGIGQAICRFAMEQGHRAGCKTVWLNSQLHAVGFYQRLGFQPQGEPFMEAGIEHIKMICYRNEREEA